MRFDPLSLVLVPNVGMHTVGRYQRKCTGFLRSGPASSVVIKPPPSKLNRDPPSQRSHDNASVTDEISPVSGHGTRQNAVGSDLEMITRGLNPSIPWVLFEATKRARSQRSG